MKYLIAVDVQNDFITGTLGSDHAAKVYPNIIKRIKEFDGEICLTKDTHDYATYAKTQEGKLLPVLHTVGGTDGWEFPSDLNDFVSANNLKVYKKSAFCALELILDLVKINNKNPIESIEVIGYCTDICVISFALALKGFLPETKIIVNENCTAGTTPENHRAALQVMRSCQMYVE